ncbi:hypothetical protein C0J52_03303 [Blattella germanica]|nr:hypothetical protein C0J52_03303 [Blattella germanica]
MAVELDERVKSALEKLKNIAETVTGNLKKESKEEILNAVSTLEEYFNGKENKEVKNTGNKYVTSQEMEVNVNQKNVAERDDSRAARQMALSSDHIQETTIIGEPGLPSSGVDTSKTQRSGIIRRRLLSHQQERRRSRQRIQPHKLRSCKKFQNTKPPNENGWNTVIKRGRKQDTRSRPHSAERNVDTVTIGALMDMSPGESNRVKEGCKQRKE